MMQAVYVRSYPAPPFQKREILRYAQCHVPAGAKGITEEEQNLLEECLAEAAGKLNYQVCWCRLPIIFEADTLDLTFTKTNSKGLRKNLEGCESIILFAATIGLGMDRLIAKYSRLSPAKALFFQAIGAERIESLCDLFCEEWKVRMQAEGKFLRPRFSPGYGDLPLTMQTDIFRVLDCPRKIGLTLNQSLLMTPSKSVTAIMGIGQKEMIYKQEKCSACQKTDCVFRG